MPYKEIVCTRCKGTGKSSLLDGEGHPALCSACHGEGKLSVQLEVSTQKDTRQEKRGNEPEDPEDEREKQMIASLDLVMRQKISDSKRQGEITEQKAKELEAWWGEFVETYKLPLVKRAWRMREVILKGMAQFRDVPMIAAIIGAVSGENVSESKTPSNVCPSCSGTGRGAECWKCKGSGYLTSRMPYLWSGGYYDKSFTCDHCYGRGYEVCYKCGGRKTRY